MEPPLSAPPVAVGVEEQVPARPQAVDAVEDDQRRAVAGPGDLEHRAIVVRAAIFSRAENVAVGVGDQPVMRSETVGADEVD